MSDNPPARVPSQHKTWGYYADLGVKILGGAAALVKIMEWFHIVPEQLSKFVAPIIPYSVPVLLFCFLLALGYWQRVILLRSVRKITRCLLIVYSQTLKFLLRPVLRQEVPKIVTDFFDPYPFAIKYGELEFVMKEGEKERTEAFIFDKPFRELPNIFISECTAGDWLSVKVIGKGLDSFTWAVRRDESKETNYRYSARLQWVAIAPNFSTLECGTGQLEIHSVRYEAGGITAVIRSQLRSRIRGDAVNEICGNHLGGDPKFGTPKKLTVDYTFNGQRKSVPIDEFSPIKLP